MGDLAMNLAEQLADYVIANGMATDVGLTHLSARARRSGARLRIAADIRRSSHFARAFGGRSLVLFWHTQSMGGYIGSAMGGARSAEAILDAGLARREHGGDRNVHGRLLPWPSGP